MSSNRAASGGGDVRGQATLFEVPRTWEQYWWGMPAFEHGDARPQHSLTVNFETIEDLQEFAERFGLALTSKSLSTWYPPKKRAPGEVFWDGPKTPTRYPVCIPSKGRATIQTTGRELDRFGVDYRFFVEETEADEYRAAVGEERVVVMPFHDLGHGSIPARNFIWEWAKDNGHARHWVMDDNILGFYRANHNKKHKAHGGGFFAAIEAFADRYSNLAMCGPHGLGFSPVAGDATRHSPVRWNTRVYSCTLIDTTLPHRWRGRYNEDTDLSLRLLKDGYVTCVFSGLCMDKHATVGAKGQAMAGGNTDNVYNTGDHRLAFAESLREQHPDVVTVVHKFNRWHHQVDYSPFKNNRPKLRPGVVPLPGANEWGMALHRRGGGR